MILDRLILDEYPYNGTFYITEIEKSSDGSILDDSREYDEEIVFDDSDVDSSATVNTSTSTVETTSEETVIMEVQCDIQQSAKMFSNGAIMSDWDVFFATEKDEVLPLRCGMMFRSKGFHIPVSGMVIGIAPTQLGCKVQIKTNKV